MEWLKQFVVTVCVALLNTASQVVLGLLTAFITSPVSFPSALARLALVGLVLYLALGIVLQWVALAVKVLLLVGLAAGLLFLLARLFPQRPGLDFRGWWET